MSDTIAPGYSPESLLERLPADVVVEAWMLTDSDRAAALWILTSFGKADSRIWNNVATGEIRFSQILDEPGWSDAERALLNAAASVGGVFWFSVDLTELASLLDDERWAVLLEAMRIRRAGLRGERP